MARRDAGSGIDGVLIVDKPSGPTSHDVVALVRRLTATRRVGHGGTLDPFATGVLPLFLGRATKLAEYHLADRKAYRATVCFGSSSTTDDLEGELRPSSGAAPSRAAVEAALEAFLGPISQRPPAYSAIKVAGQRSYQLARAGAAVDLPERQVTIDGLDLVAWDDTDPDRPIAIVDVRCSAGTYIRALARDLGLVLGSGAYLGALTRTASGPFEVGDAVALDDIRAAAADGPARVLALLRPIDAGLDALPRLELGLADIEDLRHGRFVRPDGGLPALLGEGPARAVDSTGRLVAIVRRHAGRLAPDKVLIEPPGPKMDPVAQDTPAGPPPARAMAVVAGIDALRPENGPILAVIGVFDGIHLGHAHLLDALIREARARAARPTVITFDHHPDEVLTGEAPPLLLDPAERLRLLGERGIELVVVQHFDVVLRMTEFDEFIHRISRRVRLAGVLMTPDAAFGHDRRGTPETVAVLAARDGFDLVLVPPFELDGRSVRSAEIRTAIAAGDLDGAARLLGRPYAIRGTLEGRASSPAELRFRLPVALPPAGDYPVLVDGAPGWIAIASDGRVTARELGGEPDQRSERSVDIVFRQAARIPA